MLLDFNRLGFLASGMTPWRIIPPSGRHLAEKDDAKTSR
jgi:hypothetical protein